jgi:hypothetical protein
VAKWSEVQCRAVQCRDGEEMGKAHMSGEVARSVGIVLKRECKLRGKICFKLHTVLSYLVRYPLCMFYLNCLVSMVVNYSGFICSRLVCIVALLGLLVVLCGYCCRTCRTMWVLLVLL